ncbi:MAG: NAD(+)/NADH kinase [Phycisphaerae bacterium]
MRIALIANLAKPDAIAASHHLQKSMAARAQLIALKDPNTADLVAANPDLIVVLGGDGSILRVAHILAGMPTPVAGINFGKLGYLAAFSLPEFERYLDIILQGHAPVTHRLMLEGSIYPNGSAASELTPLPDLLAQEPLFKHLALNDIVVNAGEPFRMIELHMRVNEQDTTTFRSDGVIVATSSGSTGYNLSAGGPLIMPGVPALVVTPLCPHSLSFRPVVLPDSATIVIHPHRVNPGTRINFDGQVTQRISEEECLVIRRAPHGLNLLENPALSHWRMLASKLHWAQSPRN